MPSLSHTGSVFKSGWRGCPENWYCPELAAEFLALRQVRNVCNKALDSARTDQIIGSSLEAVVCITTDSSELATLLSATFAHPTETQERNYTLADFLTVSEATINFYEGDVSPAHEPHPHCAEEPVSLDGQSCGSVHVSVRRAELCKCPRCWKLLATDTQLCKRCEEVVARQCPISCTKVKQPAEL